MKYFRMKILSKQLSIILQLSNGVDRIRGGFGGGGGKNGFGGGAPAKNDFFEHYNLNFLR